MDEEKLKKRIEYIKAYYYKNRDKILPMKRRYKATYYKAHRAKIKEYEYWYIYGLTPEALLALKKEQNNLCKICLRAKFLVVDHCHTTGKVRGLLCRNCNMALGNIRDNTDILKECIKYLEQSRA